METPSLLHVFCRILLSASSLTLVATWSVMALAQNDTSLVPSGTATPQPSVSPTAEPAPPPGAATPTPAQSPAQGPAQPTAPSAETQPAGPNVLPETRVAAPVERRRPRTPPPTHVVANPSPPGPTQAQVTARQNEKFDAARQTLLAPTGANSYEVTH